MERKPGKAPEDDSPRFFDDLLEKPCANHAYPIKHLLKNYGLAKRWFGNNARRVEQKKKLEPMTTTEGEKQGDFHETDGCLMLFGGPLACVTKRKQKVTRREVFAAEPATPAFLRWSESLITFDRADHPSSIPQPGRCPWWWIPSSATSA